MYYNDENFKLKCNDVKMNIICIVLLDLIYVLFIYLMKNKCWV